MSNKKSDKFFYRLIIAKNRIPSTKPIIKYSFQNGANQNLGGGGSLKTSRILKIVSVRAGLSPRIS